MLRLLRQGVWWGDHVSKKASITKVDLKEWEGGESRREGLTESLGHESRLVRLLLAAFDHLIT